MSLKRWEPDEDQYLKTHYPNTDNEILSAYLGRTVGALVRRANENLRLKKETKIKPKSIKPRSNIGKHFRKCLPPDQAERMARFLWMFDSMARGLNGREKGTPVNLDGLAVAFRKLENRMGA